MWLRHLTTEEEGWHICQENQREPCDLLVFVKEGGAWRVKLWKSADTEIRAESHKEEMKDAEAMKSLGLPLWACRQSSY
jgi:hypothetical protein